MPSTVTSMIDSLSTSVAVKAPCATVATSNITLAGLQTISGVTLVEDDRVLVVGQTDPVDNGIYSASTGTWTRTLDADGNRDLVQGTRVIVRAATIIGVEYELTTENPIVIGTSELDWELRYGANATYDQTAAEIAAGVAPTNETVPSHEQSGGEIYPERYGALLNGVTDDGAAINSALSVQSQAGGSVVIRKFAAVSSGSLPLVLPSNCVIKGPGRDVAGITVTGSSAGHLFSATNKSGITMFGLKFTGNGVSSGFSDSSAFYFNQNVSAAAVGGSVSISQCTFDNFKGDYWIWLLNTSSTYYAENFWIYDNIFTSRTGNARLPTSIGGPDGCVVFQGQADGTVGLVRDAWVLDNKAELTHKKMFGIAWHSTEYIHFFKNIVRNNGLTAITDDKGAYAFMAYDNAAAAGGPGGAKPDHIYFEDNRIYNPRSCGVYCASPNRVFLRKNTCIGQYDTSNATLPKGAYVINGATYAEVDDNYADDCFGGVVLYGATASDHLVANNNRVFNVKANGFGITPRTTYTGKSACYEITNNIVTAPNANSRALYMRFQSANGAVRLVVKKNTVSCAVRVVELFADDSSVPDLQYVDMTENTIIGIGATHGLLWSNASDSETRARIADNTFQGTWASNALMCQLQDSRGLNFVDNEFQDATSITTGFAIRTDGARGSIRGTKFTNIAAARRAYTSGSEELGMDTPTWSSEEGTVVQKLDAATANGNNMILREWINYGTTNWHPQYTSTVTPAT